MPHRIVVLCAAVRTVVGTVVGTVGGGRGIALAPEILTRGRGDG